MRSKIQVIQYFLLLSLFINLSFTSCNSQKETVASRNMQNLTAHFNILYNASEIIKGSETTIQNAHADDYDQIISVFKEPNETISAGELGKLDQAIFKANTIANQKSQSKYVDDAYFLIAKANHLKSNFFNAVEFFDYVYLNYPKEKGIKQATLAWKTRSLIASERLEEAYITIDSALKYIQIEKKSVADIYAIKAQLHIYAKEDLQAMNMLKKAISAKTSKQNTIRWTYLLAQLQQINGQEDEAFQSYNRVLKSNASFEMAFNAKLSSISLDNTLGSDDENKTKQIAALLKDSKNIDFQDQIYFQIANSYAAKNNIEKAIENYNNAIGKSTKNITQKGLAYLKIAEIYFKESDYVKSKAYYDSTLVALPILYPDYAQIKKKAENIELLADRLSIIAKEDTLQMLAKMPENARNEKIKALVELEEIKAQAKINNTQPGLTATGLKNGSNGNPKFYFNNSVAINQGIVDFKKTWGNRKLEDNWRRSEKSATDISNALANNQFQTNDLFKKINTTSTLINVDSLSKVFSKDIPFSTEMKKISDEKIGLALYDIGNYYLEVNNDTLEAVKTYEQLLKRFPEDPNKLAVYYNLYRLYNYANPILANQYKNILLNQFPESPFAKIILNPEYNQTNDGKEAEFNEFYNNAYSLYTSKKYAEVLKSIAQQKSKLGFEKNPVQLAYLNSLALGHLEKLDKLEDSFKNIVETNPTDQLIVPLIKIQLAFIDSNRAEMTNRPFALLDNETILNSVIDEPIYEEVAIEKTLTKKPAIENISIEKPTIEKQVIEQKPSPTADKKALEPVKLAIQEQKNEEPKAKTEAIDTFFDLNELDDYYFAVNVSDPTLNLSSSRFGIGQFNRVNFAGKAIKHQLKAISDQNQLIFVGPISGKEAAQTYFDKINPLMREIMKISETKYSTFLISVNNSEKITDSGTLERYIKFYEKNFNK